MRACAVMGIRRCGMRSCCKLVTDQDASFRLRQRKLGCISAARKCGSTRGFISMVKTTPYAAPHRCAL